MYNTMIKSGVYTTKAEGKFQYKLENDKADFDYVTVAWNVPVQKVKKYIQSLRLAFTVNNLATISGYSGLSPIINSSTVNATLGLDDKRGYPLARTYTIGLNLNF